MLVLMNDLAPIDPVLQHPVQRAPDNRLPAPASAGCARPSLAANALSFELLLEQTHRAERGVAPEDMADGHCQVEALRQRLGAIGLRLMPRWSRCAIALPLLIGRCEASTVGRDGAGDR